MEYELTQFLNDKNSTSLKSLDNYLTIRKALIRYNTSLCSSAPVERHFSFAGFIHFPARGCVSDSLFEKLIVLKENLNYTQ